MFYIINDWIRFTPDSKQLSSLKDEEIEISLSNQSARLLMEFIQHGDAVLSREHLLKNVWENFGLTPSNNNLYSATSELRRAFISLGENEKLIVTIHKVGFQLATNVTLIESDFIESEGVEQKKENKNKAINNSRVYFIFTVLLLSLSAMSLTYFKWDKKIKMKEYTAPVIEKVGKCNVYALGNLIKTTKEQVLENISIHTDIINSCKSQRYDIFYAVNENMSNYILIGHCEVNKNNNHENCVTTRVIK
ncbi:DNA-binding transcriptional activator CadC [Serratia entomophila]|uniref:winged helix-turn-helix domain-containing protein n=1 Tax=Serratia entomophila TaxID=42906 RepID=UPI00217A915E|nr:winged helix-turn-helix domain-containing protein [Serratia entomophila]CAI0799218.1 DNA-binding transcriptional activator CadC [Serratia entomophila]CAI0858198.1 DNA-binding transcriptional activator CadC [Serratia entomophila]CAI1020339.1 DNA-binding transcriptional activator CadC [Serratia entomophila]CAI1708130.1 DNA-binding transcriptional activator CadC [Serratia entomophila]CAI1749388.1 DNA-binding transcriptional activator CadC [Serratia entomophila]